MNVPKLRFKEFSGEWEKKRLGEVIWSQGGRALEKFVTENSEYKFISIGNYSDDSKYNDNGSRIELNEETKNQVLNKNDLIMILNDKTAAGNIIGRTLLIEEDNKYIYNQRSQRIVCKNPILPLYLYFYINGCLRSKIVKGAQGATQIYINFPVIENMTINLPSIKEQEKLANFFMSIDEKIEKCKNVIDGLEKQKKALMQKIFNQELRFKDEDGKDFPDWEEKKLGEVGSFTKGGSLSKADLSDVGIECVLYGELYTRYSEIAEKFVSKTSVDTNTLCMSKANDVILPSSGETPEDISTATCILKEGVALGGDIIVYRSELLDGRFNSYLLNHKCKMDVARIAQGKSVVHISSNALKKIVVPVPCLEEQKKIVGFLFAINEKIENTKKSLEHWQQIKKGLLQQMFV